ncbi:hypothetical protein MKY41_10635 [Sporosarcina sp. FSL W7-1349]|uniref:hypothetical protein n=1 Tax=Sporosarcina sp. FSL W7-1349 TaxID=2921561 RepID=UPI0030F8CBA8
MHMTVERVSYLHEKEIETFLDEIKHALRPDIPGEAQVIRRATSHVRRNAVGPYRFTATPGEITAIIKEEPEPQEVLLSFPNMEATCTCDEPSWCSHRIAVVFHLFSQFHSITDWLHEWREMETAQMALSVFDRTPDAWIQVLSRLTAPLRHIELNENPGVFIHESNLIEQKMKPLSPFEWEWKPLFELYYRLHLLDAAWPYVSGHLKGDNLSFHYGKWYVKNWLTEQMEKLQDSVHSIGSKPKLFEADVFHERLKEMVRAFALFNEGLLDERFYVYRLFWQGLFVETASREAEVTILQNYDTDESRMFTALFHLLQGRQDKLEQAVAHMETAQVPIWLPLADLAEGEEEIDSLTVIMQALLPHLGDFVSNADGYAYNSSFIRHLDGLLETADFPDADREALFLQYGMAGVDIYADFLVESNRFAEWAALMHRFRVTYEEAEVGGLKIALAEDPATVLPLLHTYAMQLINEKNRHSYRSAVRIFKKMKAGSKKSGKVEFWNRYIDTVREKYRRLRALMEEMEKGNLNI